jgi:biopolymer transport protein ExbB
VLQLIHLAGWPIWFLIFASIVALAIICERSWSLRASLIAPRNLLATTIAEYQRKGVSNDLLNRLVAGPLMGRIFAAGLFNVKSSREVMKESIEEAGRAVMVELERFLTTLGTIASVSPLLGLFGTVVGMIEIFLAQSPSGTNPAQMAHGIGVALYNTAFGLIVAVPSMVFYRYFRGKAEKIAVEMEQQAIKLVEIVHGERQV